MFKQMTVGSVFLLSLAGCGSGGNDGVDTATAEPTAAAEPAAAEATPAMTEATAEPAVPAPAAASSTPAAATVAAASSSAIPIDTLNATCPGNIEVHGDAGGPVYINGSEGKLKKFSDSYYEVKGSGVTISLTLNAGGPPDVSYTGPGRANGICTLK